MLFRPDGSTPSHVGPAPWFTGAVRIDMLSSPPAPARHSCAAVTFEPGARAAWHTHPPGHRHWHGATGTMTHIAVQEAFDAVAVVWLEHGRDADFLQGLKAS